MYSFVFLGDMDGSPVFILGTVLYKTLGLMLPSPKYVLPHFMLCHVSIVY